MSVHPERKRVLFLETGRHGGGSFHSLHQTICALDKARIEPIVFFTADTYHTERYRESGIECHVIDDHYYPEDFSTARTNRLLKWRKRIFLRWDRLTIPFLRCLHARAIRQMASKLRGRPVDIVHLNNTPYRNLFGAFLAERLKAVCTSHVRSTNSGEFNAQMAEYCRKHIKLYVTIARETQDYWVSKGLPEDQMELIYNGIEEQPVSKIDLHKEFNLPSSASHIICAVGMLIAIKGHAFLLEAFSKCTRLEHAALIIVGQGPLEEELKQRCRQLGIADRVRLTGHRPDARSIIASSDLHVLPSTKEPFGRVIVESAQAGVATIATAEGGPAEIIADGIDGLLVKYGDADSLARAIDELINSPTRLAQLSNAALQRIPPRYTVERNAEEFWSALKSTLAQ
ncbi:MAG TPA: hypothetical protein DDW52_26025 [Planctomycetaceae bacterium]|nr:hypothetical protein [Planctomycetaceae bacterium]